MGPTRTPIATAGHRWRGRRSWARRPAVAIVALGLLTALVLVVTQHHPRLPRTAAGAGVSAGTVVSRPPPTATGVLRPWVEGGLGTGRPGSLDALLSSQRRARHLSGSEVTDLGILGAQTGYRWPARVYLPAQYFARRYAHRTFPVVEAFGGSRATIGTMFDAFNLQHALDAAIAAHTLPPLIVVSPARNPTPMPDKQCLNQPHGPQVATYLGHDVPRAMPHLLRARSDRGGWAILGSSSGGYCAANLALRNPGQFSTVVTLGGYFSGPINVAVQGMNDPNPTPASRHANTPALQVGKVAEPMSFVLVSARDDKSAYHSLQQFAAIVRSLPQDRVTTIVTPSGGHHVAAWLPALPQILAALGAA